MGLLDQNGLLQLRMEYQKAQEEAQVNGEQLPPFEEWAKQYLEQPKGMIQK